MFRLMIQVAICWIYSIAALTVVAQSVPQPVQTIGEQTTPFRHSLTLNGEWEFHRDGEADQWKTVTVPSSFEDHEGVGFDGIGWYRRMLPKLSVPSGYRVIIRFHGVATNATVSCDSVAVGEHLGGWTPFDCDVTEQVSGGKSVELKVRVDELVGHNSQGFLPVFAPHFGGIWQDVELLIVPEVRIDDLSLFVSGNVAASTLDLGCRVLSSNQAAGKDSSSLSVEVRYKQRSADAGWTPSQRFELRSIEAQHSEQQFSAGVHSPALWSPEHPELYDVELTLVDGELPIDRVSTYGAFRSIRVDGDKLLLNEVPIQIRGILNWGYAPPLVTPSRDPAFWRKEVGLLRGYGFNLMKFCLWVPPRQYLKLCDEEGILTWMEYPTWHSQWTSANKQELEREFREFFHYDRNSPSVVLRSLTCETGPSADLAVIQSLYDQCHQMIPGSIVEDDSSWIEWNRVHDFYDDHPYGNNHTWPGTLERLTNYINEHGVKPLVLGEAIAADTWVAPESLLSDSVGDHPFWYPGFIDDNKRWISERQELDGVVGVDRLQRDSLRYALLMRKYQIEKYRQSVPFGGYVVSVIRDFPFAGMGLLDFKGEPKWDAAEWSWHGDDMLIVETPGDRRSFFGGRSVPMKVQLSGFGAQNWDEAVLTVEHSGRVVRKATIQGPSVSGICNLMEFDLTFGNVDAPKRETVELILQKDGFEVRNHWDFWVLPNRSASAGQLVRIDASAQAKFAWIAEHRKSTVAPDVRAVTVATRLSDSLLDDLEQGGRVLLIPDGSGGSLPVHNQWFLRGGPYFGGHQILNRLPLDCLADLQHFDLGSSVVSDLQWLEQIDAGLMLWDNHDIRSVKTHGLLFETGVGSGRLMVNTLNVSDSGNDAAKWLVGELIAELSGDQKPRRSLLPEQIQAMRYKLNEQTIDLTEKTWKFRIDSENTGLKNGWHEKELREASEWKPIQVGRHWEGQGYETLDGWAWYRIDVELDESWKDQPIFVWIEGADDHYELYVNGEFSGTAGDIAAKRTAFEDRLSFDVTEHVKDHDQIQIAIRVFDWYGAGGLFRPIRLSTTPLSPSAMILK
ncbi:MAG: hypothetical protein JNL58_15840 [Planctomyces sp.]|nr:hypothetical protein [Planctomyces sp.]